MAPAEHGTRPRLVLKNLVRGAAKSHFSRPLEDLYLLEKKDSDVITSLWNSESISQVGTKTFICHTLDPTRK
jgi:hypothetical protein